MLFIHFLAALAGLAATASSRIISTPQGVRDKHNETEHDASYGSLEARNAAGYVSSCGPSSGWMFVRGYGQSLGWMDAVEIFCRNRISQDGIPAILPPKGGATSAIVSSEDDSVNGGSGLRVMLAMEGTRPQPGNIFFEIKNKSDQEIIVDSEKCIGYLAFMSDQHNNQGKNCWQETGLGPTARAETRGGTYQVGADLVSYHGLPKLNP